MTRSRGLPLAATTVPSQPKPLIDLQTYAKFPQAARRRELIKLVEKYSGNGVHLFVHYTSPILEVRRRALLASGTTKKKYPKAASQLWTTLDDEQRLFWDHQAKLIRLGIASGTLSHEQCIEDAGFRSEWKECLRFSEIAVAGYLQIQLPEYLQEMDKTHSAVESCDGEAKPPTTETAATAPLKPGKHSKAEALLTGAQAIAASRTPSPELLDVLRDPFVAEPRMIYGNFAQLYPYEAVRQAEGKHQTALLRQLADLLDHSGRTFFYYYVTPHLWKSIRPTDVDETISSVAHQIWMLMPGPLKKKWATESAQAKRLLGDGNMDGLERLQLDVDCEAVWKLHEMTEEAIRVHNAR